LPPSERFLFATHFPEKGEVGRDGKQKPPIGLGECGGKWLLLQRKMVIPAVKSRAFNHAYLI